MLKIYTFLLIVSEVFCLKCHVCHNAKNALCFELEKSNGKFLKECEQGEKECATLQEKSADIYITRMCVTSSWRCDDAHFKCNKCNTDGCNTENKVEPKKITNIIKHANIIGDLIKINFTLILIISLLIALAIIWCSIRCCSKKKRIEDEDDCDEYYENETNIDLE